MKILFIEDGSIDTRELDALGINYIVCRQGSEPPKIVEVGESRLQEKYINEINAMSFEFSIYRRALQLACDSIRDMYCSDHCLCSRDERCEGKCIYEKYYNQEQFLDKAKKELEEEDVKNS